MSTKGNEYVFPFEFFTANGGNIQSGSPGLTKREYFAAMAMQGILASRKGLYSESVIATKSVKMADELIKALNETQVK